MKPVKDKERDLDGIKAHEVKKKKIKVKLDKGKQEFLDEEGNVMDRMDHLR